MMADDPDFPQGGTGGPLNPMLDTFRQAFTEDGAPGWANDGVTAVQDFLHARDVADANADAAHAMQMNLAHTRDQLVGMVSDDPSSTDLALGLAQHAVLGLVAAHPTLPEDRAGEVADSLTSDFHQQIAHASVTRWAETNAGAAREALDHYGRYLSDDDRTGLDHYITAQDNARVVDRVAQDQVSARRQ